MSERRTLNRRLRDLATWVVVRSPEAVRLRVLPDWLPYRPAELPPGVVAPAGTVRLLIAPANYAAQGHAWARAAERIPGVGARNLEIIRSSAYGFPADFAVAEHVATLSHVWSARQRRAVRRFTHVLVEAERPLLGHAFGGDLRAEHRALRAMGIKVAYVSHGSDLRLPSRHAVLDRHSPFRDTDWEDLQALEAQAAANAEMLRDIGAPIFVPTPELLLDVPEARWLPIVVDPTEWVTTRPALTGAGAPVVVHSPTNARIKGSAAADAAGDRLTREGVIEYRRTHDVPKAEMPAQFAAADVVLEQFRLGTYATTAIEAMAAGRLVVGHVSAQVRDHVRATTGHSLPIVEADPDTVEDVLRDVARRPEDYRGVAEDGVAFVRAVHSGSLSADVLSGFLQQGQRPARVLHRHD